MKKSVFVCVIACILISLFPCSADERSTVEEIISKCREAAALISEKGIEEAEKIMQPRNNPFVWKDTYVWVIDTIKMCNLTHPINPDIRFKNLSKLKDSDGKLFFAEFIRIGITEKEGWVSYKWPKPGENKPSLKVTFVMKVPGTKYVVAAGVYDKTMEEVQEVLKQM